MQESLAAFCGGLAQRRRDPSTAGPGSKSLLKDVFSPDKFPQRLEAAVDRARFTARVELVPFPFVPDSRVFQQIAKPLKSETAVLSAVFPRSCGGRCFVTAANYV
jgi:hypothetical protein